MRRGSICEFYIHNSNVIDNRTRDRCDHKENGRDKEEERPNVVEETCLSHCEGFRGCD